MPKTTESYPTSNLQQQKKREKCKRKKIKYKLRLKRGKRNQSVRNLYTPDILTSKHGNTV